MADSYVGPDQIMVQNPVAGLADDSAELPNLTEHVPVDELRNSSAHDIEESQQIQPNTCQIYLPTSNRTTKSKSHKKANKNQLDSQEFLSHNVSQEEVTNQAPAAALHTQNLRATIRMHEEREKAFKKEITRLTERLARQEDQAQGQKDDQVEHQIKEKKRTILLKHQIQELTQ